MLSRMNRENTSNNELFVMSYKTKYYFEHSIFKSIDIELLFIFNNNNHTEHNYNTITNWIYYIKRI